MKYIVHGLSYVDIIQKKIRDMKCEEYCPCHILRDIQQSKFQDHVPSCRDRMQHKEITGSDQKGHLILGNHTAK